jgi:hypothetical protein
MHLLLHDRGQYHWPWGHWAAAMHRPTFREEGGLSSWLIHEEADRKKDCHRQLPKNNLEFGETLR